MAKRTFQVRHGKATVDRKAHKKEHGCSKSCYHSTHWTKPARTTTRAAAIDDQREPTDINQ